MGNKSCLGSSNHTHQISPVSTDQFEAPDSSIVVVHQRIAIDLSHATRVSRLSWAQTHLPTHAKIWPEVHLRGLIPPVRADPSHVARLGICAWRWGGIAQPLGECSLWDLYKVISHWVTGAAAENARVTWKGRYVRQLGSPRIQCAKGQTSGFTRWVAAEKWWSSSWGVNSGEWQGLLIVILCNTYCTPLPRIFSNIFQLCSPTVCRNVLLMNRATWGCPKDSKSLAAVSEISPEDVEASLWP